MLDHGLSIQQLTVICALSSGANMTAAAQEAGVHRNTITNWRRNLLPFQRALADAQYDRALCFREKMEDLIDLAIKSIQEILTDPKAPSSVKLKAALAIMTTACTPPDPKKQVEFNIEKIFVQPTPPTSPVHKDAQPAPQAVPADPPPLAAPTVHKDAQPAPKPPSVDQPAQNSPIPPQNAHPTPQEIGVNLLSSAANLPVMHNSAHSGKHREVARNAKCPCGSNKKYKRCCLSGKEHFAAAA